MRTSFSLEKIISTQNRQWLGRMQKRANRFFSYTNHTHTVSNVHMDYLFARMTKKVKLEEEMKAEELHTNGPFHTPGIKEI
jgi:hypothetical protein